MIWSLLLVAALIAVTALAATVSQRWRIPDSMLLVVVGAALSFVPQLPTVAIEPEIVLLLLLPPLLYAAGVGMSWRGFVGNMRPILLLAVGCVVATAVAVAAAAHLLLGLPWAVAFVLGAVVSPPDAVAPMAIARRLRLPERLLTVLEGEGLVNDASALILFSFSVTAVVAGHVDIGPAVLSFGAIVVGEIVWGLIVGAAMLRLRRWSNVAQAEILLALLTPYLAFWPPHQFGGSGVIAAVVTGLYVSREGPRFIAPATRLQGYFVWRLVTGSIEGVLFLLTGLQAATLAAGLRGDGWGGLAVAALIVNVVVIGVRFAWVYPATYLPRLLSARLRARDPLPSWQTTFVVAFTGIRGVVSLAAALSIPVLAGGAPFPYREPILFITFSVIIVTLIGQGSLLPPLIRALGLANAGQAEAEANKTCEVLARIEGVEAALAELERRSASAPPAVVSGLRHRHQARRAAFVDTADRCVDGSPVADDARLQAHLIDAERLRIGELYAAGRLTDEARRRIERELDLEEARNIHALESATGDSMADPEVDGGTSG